MVVVPGGFEFVGHDGFLDLLHGDLLNREVVLDIVGHVRLAVLYGVQRFLFVSAATHQLGLQQRGGLRPGPILRRVDSTDLERCINDIGQAALLIELRSVELTHLRSHITGCLLHSQPFWAVSLLLAEATLAGGLILEGDLLNMPVDLLKLFLHEQVSDRLGDGFR